MAGKINYVTISGADNRAELLKDNFRVVAPYFSRICLLDNGSTDHTAEVGREYNVLYKRNDIGFDNSNWGNVIEMACDMVPDGQWFVFMDSDERPCQKMLDELQDNISFLKKHDRLSGVYASVHHDYGISHTSSGLSGPQYHELMLNSGPMIDSMPERLFTKSRLLYKCPQVGVQCLGPHFGIVANDQRYVWFPSYYNHVKNASQNARAICLAAYPYLRYHTGGPEAVEDEQRLISLSKKYNILLPNQLAARAAAGTIPKEMLDLWASWKDHPAQVCRLFYEWAFVYNYVDEKPDPCGQICCKYANGIQY